MVDRLSNEGVVTRGVSGSANLIASKLAPTRAVRRGAGL